MWKCLTLCIVLTLCRDARGDIGDQMTEVIQKCCDDGSSHARNHSGEDCNRLSTPAHVPVAFTSFCAMAQAQCCGEYYKKKEDCDSGIDVALSTGKCTSTKDSTKVCCDECSRGSTAGLAGGPAACVSRSHAANSDELLSDDAYIKCCVKSAKEGPASFTPKPEEPFIPSVCEDYAPNELCAHHCIPIPGSYKCECNPGFMLMADGRNCREVVKNRCKPKSPCQHKCNDNGVDVLCSCRRGYELMPDGKSCQDINECQLDIPVCLQGSKCYNIHGSYRCVPTNKKKTSSGNKGPKGQCPPGFARNLRNNACDDINECKLPRPPCPAYRCENTVGGYKCDGVIGDPVNLTPRPGEVEDKCPPGFALGSSGECEDVDECAMLKDDCNRLSQFCVNTHKSFYCQDMVSKHCPPGFKIDAMTNRCEDINECEDDPDICRSNQVCVNQLGQYDCKDSPENKPSRGWCPEGMRINPATNGCEDIDECKEGTHLCDRHQTCHNTNGSFVCHCRDGYELDAMTGACVDVNECATQQHNCTANTQRCDNTIGSFLCIRIASCGTGYILQHATGKCEDVDECAIGSHNCAIAGPEYQCMNILGSFRCVKKRVSTSSTTTAAPMYDEYEYYYSDEIIDQPASNKSEPVKPAVDVPIYSPNPIPSNPPLTNPPLTNPPPTSTEAIPPPPPLPEKPTPEEHTEQQPEEPRTLVFEPPPEEPQIVEYNPEQDNAIRPDINNNIPNENRERENESPKPIEHIPEVPRYYAPLYTTPVPNPPTEPSVSPEITYSEPPEIPSRPDIVYEPNSEPPQRKESPDSTYYETRPDKPVSSNEIAPEIQRPTERVPDPVLPVTERQPEVEPDERRQRPTYSPFAPTVEKHPEQRPVLTNEEEERKHVQENERPNCPPGFEANENGGCFDIDECASSRHSCSGFTETCRNTYGGYLCDCAPGFRRDPVTAACNFVITTSSTTSTTTEPPPPTLPTTLPPTTTPEPVSSTTLRERPLFFGYPDDRPLVTRPFKPRNWCDAGYHLNAQKNRCEDIDECTNGQANCAAVEICINTRGGYRCECPPNWRLDDIRHRCVPARNMGDFPPGYGNEPVFPPADPQESIDHGFGSNSVNPEITQIEDRGTVLKCPWGYRLEDDNCVDVNECATGEAKCGPLQFCTNLPGGYTCSCPRGHKLVGDHECEDVDECTLAGNMSICSRNADCVNTIGSYQCKCHDGFRPAPINDKVCVDVDECSEARAGSLCEQRCSNVWGGYRCSCHRGYRLSADNRTCVDVDECLYKSKILCVGKCLNEPGGYRCTCPIGYKLSEDKKSCIDIDECETGEAGCQTGIIGGTSHVCSNTRGSYHCQQISCPPGYELEGKHRCTKSERQCQPGDWDCEHQPSTISYNFITFVSKLYVPDANVKLFTMRGPQWSYVQLTFELRLVKINAPPSVKEKADITAFLLTQSGHEAVISLVRPLEGPQSIELELSMELHNREQFGGIAIAKVFIYVSEYEF